MSNVKEIIESGKAYLGIEFGSPMYGFRMRSDCAPHRSVLL